MDIQSLQDARKLQSLQAHYTTTPPPVLHFGEGVYTLVLYSGHVAGHPYDPIADGLGIFLVVGDQNRGDICCSKHLL